MKKIINHNSVHNRKGSILIWSLLLGFVLTSVFFFFGMRQRTAIAEQRDTAAILNARAYLESYADYLEKHPDELDEIFDDIQVSLTQQVNEIEDIADTDAPVIYYFASNIFVEWNKCSDNLKGDLLLNSVLYEHDDSPGEECDVAEEGYDDVIGPISVSDPFTIETLNAPFYFRITGTGLKDNKWHLDLSKELEYGKKVTVKRTF